MPDLVAASPLGAPGDPARWSSPSIALAELTDVGLLHLRGRIEPAVAERLEATLGLRLPATYLRPTPPPVRALRVRADHWCLVVDAGARTATVDALRPALAGTSALVADATGGALWLRIEGRAAAHLLAAACAVDMDARSFAVGQAIWTRFARIRVLILREAVERFDVELDTSYGRYAWDWLVHNARLVDAVAGRAASRGGAEGSSADAATARTPTGEPSAPPDPTRIM